jgi:hypothetical protein
LNLGALLSEGTLTHSNTPTKMSFTSETVQRIAAERFRKEQAELKAAQEKAAQEAAAAALALKEAERLARIRAEQEREEARLRAERALAEEKIRAEAAALDAAVEAELQRLRNRTEIEVLRDEVAELKKQIQGLTGSRLPLCAPKSYKLSVVANNSTLGGDPHYGVGKILVVTYKMGGEPQKMEVEEHQTLHLQGPNLQILSASWETNPRRRAPQTFKADVLSWVVGYLNEVA